MFVGAINKDVRAVVAEAASSWKGPVYVGCSGNFTLERILHAKGIKEIHSNDVSLYSSALGTYLATGSKLEIAINDERLEWLYDYMEQPLEQIATLLMCSDMFQYLDRYTPYHQRMLREYGRVWDDNHARTVSRIEHALKGMSISSYTPGDVIEYMRETPEEATVISFSPTYAGGYEQLYKKMDGVFSWDKPVYPEFGPESFDALTELMTSKQNWMVIRDAPIASLEENCTACVQTGMRSEPVYVYVGSREKVRITQPHQKTEPLRVPRLEGEIEKGEITLIKISTPQLNALRSQYLDPKIVPAKPLMSLGVLVDRKLAGALAFSPSQFGVLDAYMMSDFPVDCSPYKRLSKLVLVMSLTREVKAVLEQSLGKRVRTITTTAFTEKAASMKYRGLYERYSKKEGVIHYRGQAGRWTMREAFKWWREKHAHAH